VTLLGLFYGKNSNVDCDTLTDRKRYELNVDAVVLIQVLLGFSPHQSDI